MTVHCMILLLITMCNKHINGGVGNKNTVRDTNEGNNNSANDG